MEYPTNPLYFPGVPSSFYNPQKLCITILYHSTEHKVADIINVNASEYMYEISHI